MSHFSTTPTLKIGRSKFDRKSQLKTNLRLGKLIPIYLDEVLPGDTRKIDMASLVQMDTPVFPFMDNVYLDVYAFYVPNRILWDHWKEFMGSSEVGAGIPTTYTIPQVSLKTATAGISVGSVGDYFGLPILATGATSYPIYANLFPIRGYNFIWNTYFRNPNVEPVKSWVKTDSAGLGDTYDIQPYSVNKFKDYFTTCLPYAQKHSPISIFSASATAPVYVKNTSGISMPANSTLQNAAAMPNTTSSKSFALNGGSATLDVHLDEALNTTINDLRFQVALQNFYERDLVGLYPQIIESHYGVATGDASLQLPEKVGHWRMKLNVNQVLNMTGIDQATPGSNKLGNRGAVSVTGGKGEVCSFSATEHGYLHIYAVIRQDETYGQGLACHWSRKIRTDIYDPCFAHIGNKPVYVRELYCKGTADDSVVFGYQEAWSEYRFKENRVTGIVNPSVANSLGYVTLANNFGSRPYLNSGFINATESNIARVLQNGQSQVEFIADFAFKDVSVRPMPLYSDPGLMDHIL